MSWKPRLSSIVALSFVSALVQADFETLPVPVPSDQYEPSVMVSLPPDYAKYPNRKYITIYFLDSQSQIFYDQMRVTNDYLRSQGLVPPTIFVGVSSIWRQYDFTPVPTTEKGKKGYRRTGGAEGYRSYLTKFVMPAVEKKYRCSTFRVGVGHSLGGTFMIDTLLSENNPFRAAIAISPNVMFDDEQLIRRLGDATTNARLKDRFLYLAHGHGDRTEDAFLPTSKKFNKEMQTRKFPGAHYHYEMMNNESHGTTPTEGVPKGLIALFNELVMPYQRYDALLKQSDAQIVKAAKNFYAAASAWSGLKLPLIETANSFGYRCFENERKLAAQQIFDWAVALHPEDSNLWDSAGEITLGNGNKALARTYYERSLALIESQKSTSSAKDYAELHSACQQRIADIDKQK